jgi:hypothetical protein
MADADLPDFDEQDQAEVFDEDNTTTLEGAGSGSDMLTFEELPEVYDVTSALGDRDVDDVHRAQDADELDDEELEGIGDDLEYDDEAEDDLPDQLEDVAEDDEIIDDEDDLDDVDGVDDLEDDEVDQELGGDLNDEGDDDEVSDYESEDELSDEDVQELGYSETDLSEEDDEEEEEEVDEEEESSGLVTGGRGKPAQGNSGEAADLASERLKEAEESHDRQDVLLDEGVEETFPASDPVSVKRIT